MYVAEGEEMKILSFGAGVNSTALLVLHNGGKCNLDAVVFADTGSEHPETYEYIKKHIEPLCQKLALPFHYVSYGDLYQDYWEKQIIPFRAFRSCTDKYKIRPIKKFVKSTYGEEAKYIIGIDYGEKHRAERFRGSNFEFPLIDMQIDREGCKSIIRDFGLPIPIKSGCFFCPFTSKRGWKNLLENHRELFLKAEAFEKNSAKYPKFTLTNKLSLKQIREAIEKQKSLCSWVEEKENPCLFCHS